MCFVHMEKAFEWKAHKVFWIRYEKEIVGAVMIYVEVKVLSVELSPIAEGGQFNQLVMTVLLTT